jgi:cellular nucleic acid-binding protein
MHTNIYILKLENNKYYVGKSNDLETRLTSHKNGLASAWTKKYKPISVEKVIPNASSYDENKETIEYMGKYGIDNVRGGIYITEALDNTQRSEINKQIWGANDCCTQCGRKEHFVKNCKETKDVTGQDIIKTGQDIFKTGQDIFKTEQDIIKTGHDIFKTVQDIFKTSQDILKEEYKDKKLIKTCFDCGKIGHYADKCPNKKETFNCRYCDKEFETQKGAIFHENVHCKKKNECYRCGRLGHYSNNCYAKFDIDGYQLD